MTDRWRRGGLAEEVSRLIHAVTYDEQREAIRAFCDRIEALDCDLAEARAELAAERGEAAGALPSWVPSWLGDDIPAYQSYMGGDPAVASRVLWAEREHKRISDDRSAPRSIVWRWDVDDCETGETIHTGTAPTAHAAMRAAELAYAR